jgi:shikimate dehydrogenase
VTIPYKEAVIAYLDHQDETVQQIGACNCIRVKNGSLTGYNTDAIAFTQSLRKHLKPHHKRALVLGSGGASRAIRFSLEALGIGFILVSRFRKGNVIDYDDLSETLVKDHPLIINTTPLGMYPDNGSSPPLPYDAIDPSHLLFDLVYNPERTGFMIEGEKRGAQVVNGYEMLVLQAEESWRIWNEGE